MSGPPVDVINVYEAKTTLSRLLERVEQGEEIVIARSGTPVARLSPYSPQRREPGALAGRVRVKQDFDDPLPQGIAAAFAAPNA